MYNIQISKYPNIQISKYPNISKKFLLTIGTILQFTRAEPALATYNIVGSCSCWSDGSSSSTDTIERWGFIQPQNVNGDYYNATWQSDCQACVKTCYDMNKLGGFIFDQDKSHGGSNTCFGFSSSGTGPNDDRCGGCDWALSERHAAEPQRENSKNTHKK